VSIRQGFTFASFVAVGVLLTVGSSLGQHASSTPATVAPAIMALDAQKTFLTQYCTGCHNDTSKTGGMTLTSLNLAHPDQTPELAEKIVKKLRTGLMPPAIAAKRPDVETARLFRTALESELDKAAALHPNPGTRLFGRLTRDEYARSVRQLLGIEVDVEKYLPPDTTSDGLDNLVEAQAFSASLTEGYMRAAAQIAREALGDPNADATSAVYKLPRTASQLRHVDGAPFGTRGGISTVYNFPADGEYSFRSLLHGDTEGHLYGNAPDEQLEISIDGERVALLSIDPTLSEETSATGLNLTSPRVFVRAASDAFRRHSCRNTLKSSRTSSRRWSRRWPVSISLWTENELPTFIYANLKLKVLSPCPVFRIIHRDGRCSSAGRSPPARNCPAPPKLSVILRARRIDAP